MADMTTLPTTTGGWIILAAETVGSAIAGGVVTVLRFSARLAKAETEVEKLLTDLAAARDEASKAHAAASHAMSRSSAVDATEVRDMVMTAIRDHAPQGSNKLTEAEIERLKEDVRELKDAARRGDENSRRAEVLLAKIHGKIEGL